MFTHMTKLHVKKGDVVTIISGKDKSKTGKILEVRKKEKKVIVEGCNISTKHIKPRRQGEQGSIAKVESPLYSSKVMVVCPKCGKSTRVGHVILSDGNKQRVCKNKDCKEFF